MAKRGMDSKDAIGKTTIVNPRSSIQGNTMMTAKTRSKLPSTKLGMLFKEINSTFGHAKELVLRAYTIALQENYSPIEAKQLLLDNITEFKKTQIYAYLPSECKDPVKQKAGYLSHKSEVSVPIPEQNTETAFKPDSNEQVLA